MSENDIAVASPTLLAIALDLMIHPDRRKEFPEAILKLVDQVIETVQKTSGIKRDP